LGAAVVDVEQLPRTLVDRVVELVLEILILAGLVGLERSARETMEVHEL
jgi:hypothetical protein